jgi:hypothetical protein
MLKINVEEHAIHVEFGGGGLNMLLAELSMAINRLYENVCDQNEAAGEYMKIMLQMAITDNDSPIWQKITKDDEDGIKSVEIKLPGELGDLLKGL